MTDIVKKLAPEILSEIKKANNILLHCHPSPDPDSVGSVLAMKLALEQLGKKVTAISGDSTIPKAFQFPGVESILAKSYGEINPEDFDLFIALDSSSKDQISYKKEPVFSDSMKVIAIDHHKSNKMYGSINCVDSSYCSTALMVYDLFKEIGIVFNHDIALNLFIGIYTDTGGFRYSQTDSHTFEAAVELTKFAPDFSNTIFIMENSNNKETLLFEGIALSSVKSFFDGQLVISSVTFKELQQNNIKVGDFSTGLISNKLKSVIGTQIAITFVEPEENFVKVSCRTRDSIKFDVSKLMVAIGGGGHANAGGARLNMTMESAIDKVVKTAKEIYNL